VSTSPAPTCPRHPDVETRLRCSACDTLICPSCGVEAAVGYQCPDCAHPPSPADRTAGTIGAPARARSRDGHDPAGRLPVAVGARGAVVGLIAAALGGLVLSPVMLGGTFLLISSGVVGWLVARAVYWGTGERNGPFVRALAMTLSGFSVAVALALTGVASAPTGLLLLAYPAAVYGGWMVVRRR
jgi:hypothetical protein